MLLTDKVVWITGASRGIGAAIAREVSEQGGLLVIAGRREEALVQLQRSLPNHTSCLKLVYDVTDFSAVKMAAQQIRSEYGRLDGLINNAGVLNDAVLGMISEIQMDQVLNVNLKAVINHMQLAARLITQPEGGTIVNISSIIGRVGNAGQAIYAASKAGVIGATMAAAKELASRQIRVNAVAPGYIDTDMIRHLPPTTHADRLKSIAMQRLGTPRDVARVVTFLVSDLSSYVTGQVIGVDGGMLI
ncbi:MAG TPA: SDR family NAD(P)-dependent oxidoreductase [Kiritimatiellia bacterium]|nr:SDR family NAD(P)-dependent oxidoreductase [Kiritimatiellia bacterium]